MFDFSRVAPIILFVGGWWAFLTYIGIHLVKLMNIVTRSKG